ncbi:hypothetical protein Tco_0917089 [Tanacetum coccineum]
MEDPNINIEEYIRLEEEKTHRRAIVFNDTLTSEAALSCEPTVSSLNNDETDFRISFDESDDEDCTNCYTFDNGSTITGDENDQAFSRADVSKVSGHDTTKLEDESMDVSLTTEASTTGCSWIGDENVNW